MKKHFYVKRKDGQVFAIPEHTVDDTLKQGFELVGEVLFEKDFKGPEVTEVEEKAPDDFTCILCGFVGKNERSLRMHRNKKHA